MPVLRRSISRKLTGMNMRVSAAAVLLACAAFIGYDLITARQMIVSNLSIQAQIIGSNSVSALTFGDERSAETTLAALSAASNVTAAGLYDSDGRLFVAYRNSDASPTMLPPSLALADVTDMGWSASSGVTATRPIVFQGVKTGAVYIHRDLRDLQQRMERYVIIAGAVLFISLITALILSPIAQRSISRPIVGLAELARRISRDKDFSVRAQPSPHHEELGVLTDAFNELLLAIQARDASLLDSQSRLEERVRVRTAELAALNQELESFSYSVSHDLRAPLRHVAGFVSLLERHAKTQLDDKARRYLETIATSAQRMGRLIDDLLAFSRTSRSVLVKKPVRLETLVRDAQADATTGAESRDIAWTIHPLPVVDADQAMLRIVLVNLLSNAVKYTGTRQQATIEVGALESTNGETTVFVRDNGVGFDMQYAHKLFGVFQRLHGVDEFDGTGIGLATVRRIVERHGGRVWAQSHINNGAEFCFSLPRETVAATEPVGAGSGH